MWDQCRVFFLISIYQSTFTYCSEDRVAVLILARGGSQGIPLKNLALVGGVSLLSRSIGTARFAGFSDITVSTDHPLIAIEALKNDAEVFRRSHTTASNAAPSLWGVAEFLAAREDVNVVALLQATSPFTRAFDLNTAVDRLLRPPAHDCVFTVTRNHKLRWKNNVAGSLEAVNFKPEARPRRQDWEGELVESGALYVVRKNLIQLGYLQNVK